MHPPSAHTVRKQSRPSCGSNRISFLRAVQRGDDLLQLRIDGLCLLPGLYHEAVVRGLGICFRIVGDDFFAADVIPLLRTLRIARDPLVERVKQAVDGTLLDVRPAAPASPSDRPDGADQAADAGP